MPRPQFFFPPFLDNFFLNTEASIFISCWYTHNGLMLLSTAPFTHVFPFIRQLNYVTQGLFLQDIQSTTELQSSAQGINEVQSQQPNAMATDAPAGDSGSLSVASNDNKKVSREDIELVISLAYWMAYLYNDSFTLVQLAELYILLQVQNLIERCLQLYMNKGEVVRTLSTRARIEPGFTTLGNVLTFCWWWYSCVLIFYIY